MKKWNILNTDNTDCSEITLEKLIDILLENRGIKTKKEREAFLNPLLESVTPKTVGIDIKQLNKALARIKKAIEEKDQIVVFGDYDVDGITATAILWETLYALKAQVIPYIPNRIDEGYGLSEKGITNVLSQNSRVKLIITVDNGIVANKAVEFANKQGLEVIITDHHTVSDTLPQAHAIVHTTELCGAGIAYLLSKEIIKLHTPVTNDPSQITDTHLELAALGTIADLVPLVGANRAIVKNGLKSLSQTKRAGLLELFKQARINFEQLGTYEVGYIIGPRLNAAGRIESAMDSLRLICTKDTKRAVLLAEQLELTNRQRQDIMKSSALHAINGVRSRTTGAKKILIVAHEDYPEGIIGLVAGKLVEEFYRPAIVISIGEKHSKASARSINGFNIIEFLRSNNEYFINVGGHPMAAGFTVETEKIFLLQETLENLAEKLLDDDKLIRVLRADCNLPFSGITKDVFQAIQNLSPFGMGNPEPVFVTKNVTVENIRILGKERTHLKLTLQKDKATFEGIAFGMAKQATNINIGDKIDIAYTIDENTWNGDTKIQLKIKDIKTN